MSKRVRGLACLFFVAHFAASVYVVLTSIGANMAVPETGRLVTPNRLMELAAEVLPFPILPIALSLPIDVSRFVPFWSTLFLNSLLWTGTCVLLASKRARPPLAA